MKKILLLLCGLFITTVILFAQDTQPDAETGADAPETAGESDTEDPELEAFRKEQEEYFRTGFELFIHYPVSIHFPGWSFPEVDYDWDIVEFQLPGPNISWGGLGAGFEVDFGSRKAFLKNMGIGSVTEVSGLSSFNMMDDVDLTLLINFPYLYYTSRYDTALNFTVRAGMGIGIAAGSEDLFAYPEEKDHLFGALYALEGAVVFSPGRFRFQLGGGYRFLAINSKNIHIFTPQMRAGYRF
ncbi:MAG: hypothetical protein PQJ58_17515 [Spirochaetales bacterium]|nr:hypothetical protein [Spirochaetales bacterium]